MFPGVPFIPLGNLVVGDDAKACYGQACSAATVAAAMKLPVHVLPTVAVMTGTDFCDLGAGFTDSVLACLRRCHGKRVTLSSSMAAAAKVGVIVKFVRLIWQLVQKENCDVAGGSGGSGSDASGSGSGAIGSGASVGTALGSDSHSAVTALDAKMCELLHPRLTQEASAVGNSDAMRVVSRIYSCHLLLLLLLLPFYLGPAACCTLDPVPSLGCGYFICSRPTYASRCL